jgi:putative tryptophan/tyrosine transport system substrate-binding protein
VIGVHNNPSTKLPGASETPNISADSFFVTARNQIVALAARYAIPVLYHRREFTAIGGLVSYGTSLSEAYRLVGTYAGRILNGD